METIEGFRLSPQQRHLWLLQELGSSLPYRVQRAVLIEGKLEPEILKLALQNTVARCEVLRTVFHYLPGMATAIQVVTEGGSPEIDEHDLTGMDPNEQEGIVAALFDEASGLPFNFEQGPLLHVSLVSLSESAHVLIISLPALCADATALENLVREIERCYSAFSLGEEVSGELIQYADLSEWQNDLLEAEDAKIGREYWFKQNLSAASGLKLPFTKQDAEEYLFAPQTLRLMVNADLVAKLRPIIDGYNTSLSAFLLSCWQALLWRLTGQSDVIVSVASDGRNYEELEDAIGLFAKYLPVYCSPEESTRLSELVRQTDESTREIYKWQDCFTWERNAGEAGDTTEKSFAPFCFEWSEQPLKHSSGGLSFSIHKQYVCIDRFEVKLSFIQDGNTFTAEFHYDSNLFDIEDIERLASQFNRLLEAVAVNPNMPIGEFEILSDVERHQLLVEFNNTKVGYTGDVCIHEIFAAQSKRTPEAVAVVYEDEQITYRELDRKTNQLARHLQSSGVRPETAVGICVERSTEMMIGLLGILKAGGSYVPLDPAYPKDRLAFILKDAKVQVLLTQERLIDALPEHGAQVICLDSSWKMIAEESEAMPVNDVTPENLAYVIYTSGSTGRPKGVCVEHRQLVNYVKSIIERLALPAGGSFATGAAFAADLGNTAIFPSLVLGGRLHVISQERVSEAGALADYMRRHPIDCLKIVPSHLSALLAHPDAEQILPRLRLILGGEASAWHLIKRIRALAPDCLIFNHYGPTEATVGVLTYRFDEDQKDERSATLPLGRPIANTQIYLLDSRLQPVSSWLPGEVYIGGDNLARGYLDRPELTAEKFIPNCFGDEPGSRLYRTGDLARHLSDGSIEFLGRKDQQVKIRGFRIEPGEIEAALADHPVVQQAVVLVRESKTGDKYLVAYVTAAPESRVIANELRNWLGNRLPYYMVPSAFLKLDSIPLTPNGKIDHRAFPAPDETNTGSDQSIVPLRTAVEDVVEGIWLSVLNLERVGVHERFFELGGHSLLATQVIARVRAIFQVEISLRNFFEQPTVAGLAAEIEKAMREARGILAPPIVPVARDRNLPLSYAQQRLWFLDQMESGNVFYNIPMAIRIVGTLDMLALEKSFNEIIRRHEALRTRFETVEGRPVQVIMAASPLKLEVNDLRSLPEQERQQEVMREARQEAGTGFDLSRGPMLRVRMVRVGEQEYVLVVVMHHIISDGWSMGVMIREVAGLYEAYREGRESPLAELEIQYADYAVWQREWLRGEELERQVEYWKKQMEGAPSLLELPTDRPRPEVQSYRGSHEKLRLTGEMSERLRELSRREGVTLFMTLLAAFQVLLSRYSGQQDILISTGIANRTRAETESLIGFFVNTLVLRSDLSGNPSFRELLKQVREVTLGAYAHQDMPFELLVEALQPERNASYTPIFQVMMVLQNATPREVRMPTLELMPLEREQTTAKFDLTLFVEEQGQEMACWMEYNTDLFNQSTIRQMLESYEQLLEEVIKQPDAELEAIPMISAQEREQLRTAMEVGGEQESIVEMIGRAVEAHRHSPALRSAGKDVSYEELDEKTNRLANYLLMSGASKATVVAIMAEDVTEVIVAIIATMKAGCAFMPMDGGLPLNRLAAMMEVSRPAYLIADSKSAAKLSRAVEGAKHTARLISVDEDVEQDDCGENVEYVGRYLECEASCAPDVVSSPDDLSYIYFTSGSTGVPKAIAGRLKGIDHFIRWEIETLGLDETVRVSQLLPLTFDGSLRDIFVGLCAGGVVCVPESRDVVKDVSKLIRWLDEQRVTLVHCVPSLMRAMLNEGMKQEELGSLRQVVMAGEALLPADVGRWKQIYGERVELINLYGTSETTMAKFSYRVREGDERKPSIPVGKPIRGAEVLLLNRKGEPCGAGTVGEIYIRTPYRSLGYYNQPELTSEAFIRNPFSEDDSDIVYRTGDLGRELEDGNYEYLGRRDQQVKVRGMRVELGEIENLLRKQEGIKDVAVIDREDASGYNYLCAYVVIEEGVKIEEINRVMEEELAEYQVPGAYVEMEELPRTISGKVDRRRLPRPGERRAGMEEYEGPRSEVEERLVGMWGEMLGIGQIGIRDNFFRIGGHSLMATQVVSRVREEYGVEIELREMFEGPTVAGLGERIEEAQRVGEGLEAPTIGRASRDQEIPLSFAQQRLWFLDQLEPNSAFYNIPAAVRLTGELDEEALERTFGEIVRRHEVLRTRIGTIEGRPVQVISEPEPFKIEVEDISQKDEEEGEREAERIAVEESQKPFDLAAGPMIRVRLIRTGQQEHVLVVVMHHIISDGWSMGVMIREMAVLYEAYREGRELPLAELEIQYADYAVWQREYLQGEVLQRQVEYWKQQLQGAPPLLELPTDRPRPAVQSYRGAKQSFILPETITEGLRELSRREGVTLFMTMLAAFQVLLSRYTGQEQIIVGTPIAGRTRGETEELIGFFVNTLVMKGEVRGKESFREMLKGVRETALGAYGHQNVPFEMLVEQMQPERSLSHSPLFQVAIALQNAPMQALRLHGLTITPVQDLSATAKFDLFLNLNDSEKAIVGKLEYNSDLFDDSSIKRMLGHLERLFEEIVADPLQRVSELRLLSASERDQILIEWNENLCRVSEESMLS